MNQENLKFLQDRLFYLGTEKRLHADLEKNIAEGKPEFKLAFSNHYDRDKLSATLHFRKSDTTDMYFLNRYDATLQKPAQENTSQTFYLDRGKGVSMKEAYNLLDGRSVNKDLKNKDGVAYNAWVKLDFNNKDENGNAKMLQFHKNYGYDLSSELLKLPLPSMPAEDYKQFMSSLERGNLQQIKFSDPSKEAIHFLAANPQFKTIDVFDEKGRLLSKAEKNDLYLVTESIKKEVAKGLDGPSGHKTTQNMLSEDPVSRPEKSKTAEIKQNGAPEKKENKKELTEQKAEQKLDQKNGVKVSKKEKLESLLPKNNTKHKKGLSL